jgi:hypothetical protein
MKLRFKIRYFIYNFAQLTVFGRFASDSAINVEEIFKLFAPNTNGKVL